MISHSLLRLLYYIENNCYRLLFTAGWTMKIWPAVWTPIMIKGYGVATTQAVGEIYFFSNDFFIFGFNLIALIFTSVCHILVLSIFFQLLSHIFFWKGLRLSVKWMISRLLMHCAGKLSYFMNWACPKEVSFEVIQMRCKICGRRSQDYLYLRCEQIRDDAIFDLVSQPSVAGEVKWKQSES